MCDALPNLLNICERLHPSPLRTAFLTSPALARDRLLVLLLSAGREQMSEAILEHRDCSREEALGEAAKALAAAGVLLALGIPVLDTLPGLE